MTNPPKKQFVLFAPTSGREPSFITFKGYEWTDLLNASYFIRKNYGRQFAVEINGRCFVLSAQETLSVKNAGIPFQLGFYNDTDVVALPFPGTDAHDYLQWLTEEEREVATDWTIVEQADPMRILQGERGKELQFWKTGTIGPYTFRIMIYYIPSKFGVHEGNILRLELRMVTTDEMVAHFNHDWVILPDDVSVHRAIDSLVNHYKVSEDEVSTES